MVNFNGLVPNSDDNDDGFDTALLRGRLGSSSLTGVQPRLWSRDSGIVSVDDLLTKYTEYTDVQANSQNALANISTIDDPF